jgi:diguanylate cyclase (GGDEF)-like protein
MTTVTTHGTGKARSLITSICCGHLLLVLVVNHLPLGHALGNVAGWLVFLSALWLSIAALIWKGFQASPPSRYRWWLASAGVFSLQLGILAYLLRSLLTTPVSHSPGIPVFFQLVSAVPFLFAITLSFDEYETRRVRWLDVLAAVFMAVYLFLLVFSVVSFSGARTPEQAHIVDILFDVDYAFLGFCTAIKLADITDQEERTFFSTMFVMLLLTTLLTAVRNRAIVHHNGPFWNVVFDAIFLLPLFLVGGVDPKHLLRLNTYPGRTLRSISRIGVSLFVCLGTILLAIGVHHFHFRLGALGIVLSVIQYGFRVSFVNEEKLTIDSLTRIPNRRSVDEALQREWEECMWHSRTVALFMIDLDYFKLLNDTRGHLHGDRVLTRVAAVLCETIDEHRGFVGRYGGEEFLALVCGIDSHETERIADALRHAVEGLALPNPSSPFGVVTVSVGACVSPVHSGVTSNQILQQADEALYAAKQNGRNCFEAALITPDQAA